MSDKTKIVYIGADTVYFDKIKERYKKQCIEGFKIDFVQLWDLKQDDYYFVYIDLIESNPDIIYVDFTEKTDHLLDVFRLVSKDIFFKNVPTVGLIESTDILEKCRGVGVSFLHIKCAELHDSVYDPMYVAYPKSIEKSEFAKAVFKRDDLLIVDFNIVGVTGKSIQVEGNIKLEAGEIVKVDHSFPRANVPSNRFKATKRYTQNMKYDCAYGYELDFIFVNEPKFDKFGVEVDESGKRLVEIDEKADSQEIVKIRKERIEKYKEDFQLAVHNHKKWLKDRLNDYNFPETGILLVDNKMTVVKDVKESFERSNFSVYSQTYLPESLEIIDRKRPDIIVFNYYRKMKPVEEDAGIKPEEEGEEKKPEEKQEEMVGVPEVEEETGEHLRDTLEQIQDLMKYVKADQKYNPFLVIFGCQDLTTSSFQNTFSYKQAMVMGEKANMDFVLKMAGMHQGAKNKKYEEMLKVKIANLKKQDPKKYRNITAADFKEKKCEIKKFSDLSHAKYWHKVKFISMTESELGMVVDRQLDKCTYRTEFPTSISFTIVETSDRGAGDLQKGEEYFHGLIHTSGEDEKKKIRLFVNKIFFSDLDEKKKAELEEFKKLNRDVKSDSDEPSAETSASDEDKKE